MKKQHYGKTDMKVSVLGFGDVGCTNRKELAPPENRLCGSYLTPYPL